MIRIPNIPNNVWNVEMLVKSWEYEINDFIHFPYSFFYSNVDGKEMKKGYLSFISFVFTLCHPKKKKKVAYNYFLLSSTFWQIYLASWIDSHIQLAWHIRRFYHLFTSTHVGFVWNSKEIIFFMNTIFTLFTNYLLNLIEKSL